MYNLGCMYELGLGTTQNYNKALEWYKKAAEAGSSSAMYNIGVIYKNGFGVSQDEDEALKWYTQAADAGNTSAIEAFDELRKIKLAKQNKLIADEIEIYIKKLTQKIDLNISGIYFYDTSNKKMIKKIDSATKSYAHLKVNELPVAGWDNTFFGSAVDGCLFTNKGIYIHNDSESDKPFIAYNNIIDTHFDSKKIYINSKYIAVSNSKALKVINQLIEIFKSQFAQENEQIINTKKYNEPLIEKFAKELKLKYEMTNLYFYDKTDSKTQKKINNASKEYANLTENEYPIICYDATLFGSAENGCLFTTNGIFINNIFIDDKIFIDYKDINKIIRHDDKVYVNNELIKVGMIMKDDRDRFCDLIEELKIYFLNL